MRRWRCRLRRIRGSRRRTEAFDRVFVFDFLHALEVLGDFAFRQDGQAVVGVDLVDGPIGHDEAGADGGDGEERRRGVTEQKIRCLVLASWGGTYRGIVMTFLSSRPARNGWSLMTDSMTTSVVPWLGSSGSGSAFLEGAEEDEVGLVEFAEEGLALAAQKGQ